jgi:sterol desaturase/sphingolipid hydroxylase (fatty acid hydroxylase superfamily)
MAFFLVLVGGMFFWTFMEYMLHRFLGHKLLIRNKFRTEHQKHHYKKDYFTSAMDKFFTTFIFGGATFITTYYVMGLVFASAFSFGFISMYLFYEYTHRACHLSAPKNKFASLLRKHHFYHHFNDTNMNHGVTSPFWDIIFKTYVKVEKVEVNNRFKMNWLCEDGTDIVKEQYRCEYVLVKKTRFT